MKNKLNISLLLLLVLLFTACHQVKTTNNVTPTINDVYSESTIVIQTQIPNTSPTNSSDTPYTQEIVYVQLDDYDYGQISNISPDTIVLGDEVNNIGEIVNATLKIFSTIEEIGGLPLLFQTENNTMGGYSANIDQTFLAYTVNIGINQKNLIIINSDGQIIKNLPITNDQGEFLLSDITPMVSDWGLVKWLDNETIIMTINHQTMPNNFEDRPFSLLLFNQFTEKGELLLSEYPDIDYQNRSMPLVNWNGYSEMVLDSTRTRLVYATTDAGVILWDLEQEKMIVRFPESSLSNGPEWKEDDSEFIIELWGLGDENENKTRELYQVSRDGKTKQITHLGSQSKKVDFGSYSWSPDGNRIGFTVMMEDDPCGEEYTLHPGYINMSDSNQVTIFCGINVRQNIYWSRNSNQLLLGISPLMGYLGDTVILDLDTSQLTLVKEDTIPLAWMFDLDSEP